MLSSPFNKLQEKNNKLMQQQQIMERLTLEHLMAM